MIWETELRRRRDKNGLKDSNWTRETINRYSAILKHPLSFLVKVIAA